MRNSISTFTLLACLATGSYGQTSTESQPFVQSLKQISVAGGGLLFGVNDRDQIFAWTGTEWVRLEGELRQISAGSKTEIWGVNALNKVYKITPNGWQEQPGPMKMVAVAKGGEAVVAIDPQGRPFAWNQTVWTPFPNAPVLDHIGIGIRDKVYGLGKNGEIYKWRAGLNTWTRIKGSLKKISIAADGTVTGVNADNKGYAQKDSDIEAEVSGSTTQSGWIALDQNLLAIESLDIKTSLVIDMNGLLIQRSASLSPTGMIELDGDLVVDGSFYEPASDLILGNGHIPFPTYTAGGCVILGGTLKLKGAPPPNMDKALIDTRGVCVKGTFKSVLPPDPSKEYPPYKVGQIMTLLSGLGKPTSTSYVANPSDFTAAPGPKVCDARHFRNVSHRSWVEFRLPDGAAGQQIHIPGGAYNNYVFPACNRVWWDNLTFTCNAGSGWTQTQGNYDADAWCHGVTPNSPFIAVGNW